MENELIKALRASSIATEDKNKAVLNALEYSLQTDREQMKWHKNFNSLFIHKPIEDKGAEAIIWAGVALSVIVCLAGAGIKIWNFGL